MAWSGRRAGVARVRERLARLRGGELVPPGPEPPADSLPASAAVAAVAAVAAMASAAVAASPASAADGLPPAVTAVGALPPSAAFDPPAGLDPGRRGLRAFAVLALLALVVAGFLAWQARPRPEPVAPPAVAGGVEAAESSGVIVVAVAGRVHRPGLVHLPAGARVADAIEAAGGALPGVDLSLVNLARKVTDGELIVVGVEAPSAGAATGGKLNLNTATLAQLDALPGVGPVLAQRILEYRQRRGGFRSVAELRQVSGIGDATYERLKDLVTV